MPAPAPTPAPAPAPMPAPAAPLATGATGLSLGAAVLPSANGVGRPPAASAAPACRGSSSGAFKGLEAVDAWEDAAVPAAPPPNSRRRAPSEAKPKQRKYDLFDAAFDKGHVRKIKKPKTDAAAPAPKRAPRPTSNQMPLLAGKRGHKNQQQRFY